MNIHEAVHHMRMASVGLFAALVACVASASNATENPFVRTIEFRGGSATVEVHGTSEEVRIRDASGKEFSRSECSHFYGSYDQIVAFTQSLQEKLTNPSPNRVAGMVRYPLRVNAAAHRTYYVRNKKSLLARFGLIFTPDVVAKIIRSEPHDVFCRDYGSMIGNGVVWISTNPNDVLKIDVVNQ